jgi:hypothetical protein
MLVEKTEGTSKVTAEHTKGTAKAPAEVVEDGMANCVSNLGIF